MKKLFPITVAVILMLTGAAMLLADIGASGVWIAIIAVGIATSAWGLTTAGVVFSVVIGVIAIATLIGLLLRPRSAT